MTLLNKPSHGSYYPCQGGGYSRLWWGNQQEGLQTWQQEYTVRTLQNTTLGNFKLLRGISKLIWKTPLRVFKKTSSSKRLTPAWLGVTLTGMFRSILSLLTLATYLSNSDVLRKTSDEKTNNPTSDTVVIFFCATWSIRWFISAVNSEK